DSPPGGFAPAFARSGVSAIWSDVPDRNNPLRELRRELRRLALRGSLHVGRAQFGKWCCESHLSLAKSDAVRFAGKVPAVGCGVSRVRSGLSQLSRPA